MNATVNVELQQVCEVASLPKRSDMRRWVAAAIRAAGDDAGYEDDGRGCDVVIRVVGEEESRDLNSRYRHKNHATNVLAFPSHPLPGFPTERRRLLGDIAICGPVVEREAREQGKPVTSHWAHLLIHGTLHLLGYDHQNEAEAAAMERLEAQIMTGRGFADPYREAHLIQ